MYEQTCSACHGLNGDGQGPIVQSGAYSGVPAYKDRAITVGTIHYVITNGGKAPNVVPDFAEVYYYVRHPKKADVKEIFERVVNAAKGAALGTGTTMDYEIIGGTHDLLLNQTLAEVMQTNLEKVGGVNYTNAEIEFAKKIQSSFTFEAPPIVNATKVQPLKLVSDAGGGSTDVGDVSYAVPTVGMRSATWVAGVPAHSWPFQSPPSGTEARSRALPSKWPSPP